jgi:hypothetical protein
MAQVVCEAQRFRKVFVEAQGAGEGAPDLRHCETVGEPDTKMIAIGRDEHLRLVAKPAESDRVNDPVAVALKNVAGAARAGLVFGMEPAARTRRVGS